MASTATSNMSTNNLRAANDLINTTVSAMKNLTTASTTEKVATMEEVNLMSHKRYFMLMIGGWLLTAIFVFGILFMVVTHFLGRREWKRYQQRLEEERNAVNHVLVDPKFMKYTKKGWREIALSL